MRTNRHPLFSSCLAALLFIAAAYSALAAADIDGPLTVLYNERPPFMETQADGTVTGRAADPVREALEKARIQATWLRVPLARQLAIIEQNAEPACLVGKYKTPAREAVAKFSKPLSQDSPMVGLVNKQLALPASIRLDDLLARSDINVVTKQAITYGPVLDAKLAAMKAHRDIVTADYDVIFHMIQVGRGQLVFMPYEEAAYFADKLGVPIADFRILRFPELQIGEMRYLMCSRMVPDRMIERINANLPEPSRPGS